MPRNVKALLAYLFQLIGGIIFFAIEKKDKFVRFHAAQSIVAFSLLYLLRLSNSILLRLWLVSFAIWVLGIIIMIVGMVKAYNNEMYKFPVIWDITKSIFFKDEDMDNIDLGNEEKPVDSDDKSAQNSKEDNNSEKNEEKDCGDNNQQQ